ncbi:transporter substrate-binding domain-containing protein [Guyparkeria hydrothermalis]|uniref:substrate-binding periplasmic protein n=1 Tax=Guyparkeria hydrothermalis TaxID=923 RepID=UPI00202177EA|nr:transporter substrate-binding domain-containing protein [Guyparkeria hydrothermalis]MCL7743510.1 transporter substrate-binding domain-containing protein [Guyparkeria hydrothermalis]
MRPYECHTVPWLSIRFLRFGDRVVRAFAFALLVLLLPGCDLPRDIEGTQDQVREGTLRVGVIDDAAPWARWSSGEPQGVEAVLVRDLARQLKADVQWVEGSDTEVFRALAAFELDLVIGGLERTSPWRKEVALSRPYLVSRVMVGWPPNRNAKQDLDGIRIAVKPHTSVVKKLKDRGAVPATLNADGSLPLAAPEWQIRARGLTPHEPILETRKRVFALPPGENRWLHTVQRFLFERQDDVPAMIQAQLSGTASGAQAASSRVEGGAQ